MRSGISPCAAKCHVTYKGGPVVKRVNISEWHIILDHGVFFELDNKEGVPQVSSKGINIACTQLEC